MNAVMPEQEQSWPQRKSSLRFFKFAFASIEDKNLRILIFYNHN